jgi:RimJ/RimL family protein N-acetyltransferase
VEDIMTSDRTFLRHWSQTLGFGSRFAPSKSQSAEVHDTWRLKNGVSVTIRAARPDDGPIMQTLVRGLSLTSRYHRFFYAAQELDPDMLARFTHTDPMQTMTLLAVISEGNGESAVGMAQYVTGPYADRCQFAVVVADTWQHNGIATRLIRNLICIARAAGIHRMEGEILTENEAMQLLLTKLDFALGAHPDGQYLMKAWKALLPPEWKCSPLTALALRARAERGAVT